MEFTEQLLKTTIWSQLPEMCLVSYCKTRSLTLTHKMSTHTSFQKVYDTKFWAL